MKNLDVVEFGRYYHIYNRGINSCDIFKNDIDYKHFLSLYQLYIHPIAETYAWVLMPNHFHFLIKLKDLENKVKKHPSRFFSDFFNSYAQYFNRKYDRHGSLFERPFKRKVIDSESYLVLLLIYIHNNPIHHGFISFLDRNSYKWTSYNSFFSKLPTSVNRKEVINWFGDFENFKYLHLQKSENTLIELEP